MKTTVTVSNADQFKAALHSAKRGDRFVYHRGFLWTDRMKNWSKLTNSARTVLNELAKAVMGAYKGGAVVMVQRRIDKKNCDYIAVKL